MNWNYIDKSKRNERPHNNEVRKKIQRWKKTETMNKKKVQRRMYANKVYMKVLYLTWYDSSYAISLLCDFISYVTIMNISCSICSYFLSFCIITCWACQGHSKLTPHELIYEEDRVIGCLHAWDVTLRKREMSFES